MNWGPVKLKTNNRKGRAKAIWKVDKEAIENITYHPKLK